MKLDEYTDSVDEKRRWKVVRLDNHQEIPGVIVSADEDSGTCKMLIGEETKVFDLSAAGIRLVGRARS